MEPSVPPITWSLADEGMGVLERAGLAALYMTLRGAKEQGVGLSPLEWTEADLTATSVTLRWSGKDEDAFRKLFSWAWQVREGVFYLPGVHREKEQRDFAFRRVTTHSGILGTFLQHPRVQPRAKAEDATELMEEIEEGRQLRFRFRAVDPVSHGIKPLKDLKSLFARGKLADDAVELSSWVQPGVAPRYGPEKAWEGTAKQATLLMLAPIACMYMRLSGRGVRTKAQRGTRPNRRRPLGTNWIFVVPEVLDLKAFDAERPNLVLGAEAVDVASLGDAALRFAARYSARPLTDLTCYVVAMGQVSFYNPGQSVRKAVLEVKPSELAVARYRCLTRALPNTLIWVAPPRENQDRDHGGHDDGEEGAPHGGYYRYAIPSGRGRIADNVIAGKPWYTDLGVPLAWDLDALERQREREVERARRNGDSTSISPERLWFRNLRYQREALTELIREEKMWDREAERYLVEAIWDSLASLYAQEAEAMERGGSRSLEDRWDNLNDDIRRALMRAKTRVLLRGCLVELFARAGRPPALSRNQSLIWGLMDDPYEWRKARDLALLALATYSKDNRSAGRAQPVRPAETGGQG